MRPDQLALLCLFALTNLASPARAQSYQPLDEGSRWVYGSPNGVDRDTIISVGPAVFDGLNVVGFQYHGFNDGLLNFWSVGADGTVLFHGFDRPDVGLTVHYVPPIRMVVPPLVMGHTWRDTIRTLCIHGCQADTTSRVFVYTVNSVGPLTVPAGSFEAAAVEMDLGFAGAIIPRAVYTVVGTKAPDTPALSASSGGQVRWWTAGVGMVENWDGWSLLGFDTVTATHAMSWGQLKARYR